MIYAEQILYLQKLIFNIRVRREVRNVVDMMESNWGSILFLVDIWLKKTKKTLLQHIIINNNTSDYF